MRLQRCAKASMVAVVALVLSGVVSVSSSAKQSGSASGLSTREPFEELYRRGQETATRITTLTARFTETTTSSLLTRPLVATGTLAVQRPSRVVMRFTQPEERVVVIEGDRMTMVWPSRNLRQVSNVRSSRNRIQKYIVGDSFGELRRQFDIDLHDSSERPGTHEVTLVPKRKQSREQLARLDLWVERTSLVLDTIRITFANGDTKTLELMDVTRNAVLEPGTFTVPR